VKKYAEESSQLTHTIELVGQGELALTEGLARLERINQLGDAADQVVEAYLTARVMAHEIREILEEYENYLYQSASTLGSFLQEIGRELTIVRFEPELIDSAEILRSAKSSRLEPPITPLADSYSIHDDVPNSRAHLPIPEVYELRTVEDVST